LEIGLGVVGLGVVALVIASFVKPVAPGAAKAKPVTAKPAKEPLKPTASDKVLNPSTPSAPVKAPKPAAKPAALSDEDAEIDAILRRHGIN
jgi:hypothetical protein